MQSREQVSVRGVVTLARIERGKSQLGFVANVAIPQRQPDYILAKFNHQRLYTKNHFLYLSVQFANGKNQPQEHFSIIESETKCSN